jgi:hypothetical protein
MVVTGLDEIQGGKTQVAATNNGTAGLTKEERLAKSEGRGSVVAQSAQTRGESLPRGGMFVPGGVGGPGRPKQVDNRQYIEALKAGFPPDRIVELMELAIELARETKSWRGVVAAAQFAADYSLGKPVKRVESTGDSSLADLLAGVDTSKPLMSGPTKADDDDQD